MAVKPIPEGYHSVTPYMYIRGAKDAIEFYKKAFGAKEAMPPMIGPDGKVGHAEIMIGDSHIMLSDENLDMNVRSAPTLGGSPVGLLIYTEDVDRFVERATKEGATIVRPLENQFYGDRTCNLEDPFGNQWYIHQHIEDVTPEEMERRMASMAGAQG